MVKDFEKGEIVKYTGKGFIGYDRENNKMIVVEIIKNSFCDVKVEYKGAEMIVMKHEISI